MMRKYYAYEDDLNMLPPNPLEPTMFTVYLAAEVDAALAEALAERDARIVELEQALTAVKHGLLEINPRHYTHDDVASQNDSVIAAYVVALAALAPKEAQP